MKRYCKDCEYFVQADQKEGEIPMWDAVCTSPRQTLRLSLVAPNPLVFKHLEPKPAPKAKKPKAKPDRKRRNT